MAKRKSPVVKPLRSVSKSRHSRQDRRVMMRNIDTKCYGVRVGHQPGIYDTWKECQRQTKGAPHAQYKSFLTRADAQDYVNGGTGDTVKWFGIVGGAHAGVHHTTFERIQAMRKADPQMKPQLFDTQEAAAAYVADQTEGTSQKKRASEDNLQSVAPQSKRARGPSGVASPAPKAGMVPFPTPPQVTQDEINDVEYDAADESDAMSDVLQAPQSPSRSSPDHGVQNTEIDPEPEALVENPDAESYHESSSDSDDGESAALRSENEQLQADMQILREELASLERAAARRGEEPQQHESVYTLLLARPKSGHPVLGTGHHPEENIQVLDAFARVEDANAAAWDTYHKHCPEYAELLMQDHGLTATVIDKQDCPPSSCWARYTLDGQLRLYWRDKKGRAGFIMVQQHRVRAPRARKSKQVSKATGLAPQEKSSPEPKIPSECYLLCERLMRDGMQTGGMVTAYHSKDKANAAAEARFRASLEVSTDAITKAENEITADGTEGIWTYVDEGLSAFYKNNAEGQEKTWVARFLVE